MKKLSETIIESSIQIHRALGPGLLESVYTNCLAYELSQQNIPCEKEVLLPVHYKNLDFESGFRADLIVNDQIIVELKSVEKVQQVHKAQTLTYLKLAQYPLALLINFGEPLLKNGLFRYANGNEANDL